MEPSCWLRRGGLVGWLAGWLAGRLNGWTGLGLYGPSWAGLGWVVVWVDGMTERGLSEAVGPESCCWQIGVG